ncbi:CGNR zinc finger domain-containing protein [Ferrovibrio xuzhouensis]|uniref:CGNR zinc finger domain-containing protein n=1 Tax=Ferrovibrio xuzhouensis TaxID=1576914 RepID=A0ABV7VGP4_9PROT
MTETSRILALDLLGGHPALDFINTVDWRDRADAEDCLVSYAALLAWAKRVGLLDAAEAKALAQAADAEPEAADAALSAAVDLRETLHRLLTHAGKPAAADLERLNHWLAEMPATARLVAAKGGGYAWAEPRAGLGLSAPILRLAHAAAGLLASDRLPRVHVCGGPGCGWLFLDTSPSGRRRWCAMESCGNRAKAQRHYRRAKAGE